MKATCIVISGTHRKLTATATFTALADGGWQVELILGDKSHAETFPKKFGLRPCPSVAAGLFDQMLGEGRYRTPGQRPMPPRPAKATKPLKLHEADA